MSIQQEAVLPAFSPTSPSPSPPQHRQGLKIFQLEGSEYRQAEESVILPGVTSTQLARFLEESQGLTRPAWARRVREWARQRAEEND